MTATDVNADMRAKFEAGVSRYMGNGRASLARSEESGIYLVPAVESMWLGYRAAHADLAGEVRELVEAARGVERRLIPLLSGKLHDIDHADFVAFFAALAKFHPTHQEKP